MCHSCLGRKKGIIQFPICPHSLLSKPDGYLLGGRCIFPQQRLSPWFVVAGACRVSGDFSLSPFAAGRRQRFCTRRKVVHSSLLSSALKALQTEKVIAVLSLQLPGHRPPSPWACLPPSCACPECDLGLERLLAQERLGSAVSSLVEWQDSAWGCCVLREIAGPLPFYSCLFYENLSSFLCFLNVCTKPQKVHALLVTLSTLLSRLLNFK